MNKSAIGGHWNVIGIDISDSNCHLSEFEKRKRSNEESAADQQKVLKRFSSSRRRAPLSNPSRRTALNHSSSCPPLIEKHKRLALYRHELPPTRWCPYSGNRRTNTGIYTAGRWRWTTKKKLERLNFVIRYEEPVLRDGKQKTRRKLRCKSKETFEENWQRGK